jgi:DNA-binding CsgD family transcriptional regulator
LTAPAVRLLAAGVLETVEGDIALALSHLAQAASLLGSAGDAMLLPYTPVELIALVGAQCGETALAEGTLAHAVAAAPDGGLAHTRHLLLDAWNALARGAVDAARGVLDRLGSAPLAPESDLLAAALAAGVARRSGDSAALAAAFARGRTALIQRPVSLYLVRPLGELAVAAAILGERESIAPQLDQAWALLAKLGDPPLWTVPLHWGELHAELATGDLDAVRRRSTALSAQAARARHAKRFADAAACWLRVAGDERCQPDDVRAAAIGLQTAGHAWDGAQLAAAAALHAVDRKNGAALMAFARNLCATAGVAREHVHPLAADEPADTAEVPRTEPATAPQLSGRELEVGRLILAGLTYKQIGARLFISAKTVEHHVARMRNRLGVDGRNELFGMLRVLLGEADQTSEPIGGLRA